MVFIQCIGLSVLVEASDFLIVANAPNSIDWQYIEKKRARCKIIALDGAANAFQKVGKIPHVILGDFDSIEDPPYWGIIKVFKEIDQNTKPYFGKYNVFIVPVKNQDLTDLEKAIRYCDQCNARSITIVNAYGGRFDHELENFSLLKKYNKKNRPIFLHAPTQTLQYVQSEHQNPSKVLIKGKKGDFCGVFGCPQGIIISTQNLKYEAKNYPLKFGRSSSACNQLLGNQAFIEVVGEVLIAQPNNND